jgi:hypothetical protein
MAVSCLNKGEDGEVQCRKLVECLVEEAVVVPCQEEVRPINRKSSSTNRLGMLSHPVQVSSLHLRECHRQTVVH